MRDIYKALGLHPSASDEKIRERIELPPFNRKPEAQLAAEILLSRGRRNQYDRVHKTVRAIAFFRARTETSKIGYGRFPIYDDFRLGFAPPAPGRTQGADHDEPSKAERRPADSNYPTRFSGIFVIGWYVLCLGGAAIVFFRPHQPQSADTQKTNPVIAVTPAPTTATDGSSAPFAWNESKEIPDELHVSASGNAAVVTTLETEDLGNNYFDQFDDEGEQVVITPEPEDPRYAMPPLVRPGGSDGDRRDLSSPSTDTPRLRLLLRPEPLPETGDFDAGQRTDFSILVKTDPDGDHTFVKIAGVISGRTVAEGFIRAGERYTFYLPKGTYILKTATGETWFGRQALFGPETRYSKADDTFPLAERGEQWTVELIRQTDGNLTETPLDEAEF